MILKNTQRMKAIGMETQHIPTKIIGVGSVGGTVVGLIEMGFNCDDCVIVGSRFQSMMRGSRCSIVDFAEYVPVRGFDVANDPRWCCEAATSCADIIRGHLDGSALNFIVAGMGGGMGTGAAPVIAEISKSMGSLTIAVISQPFTFEGKRRSERALNSIEEIKDIADMTIPLPYDRLLKMLPYKTTFMNAYEAASRTLCEVLIDIHDFIIFTVDNSLIDGDFETIKMAMQNSGLATSGIGLGDNAMSAMKLAINSPSLENDVLREAQRFFVNITSHPDSTLDEIQEALQLLQRSIRNDADFVWSYSLKNTSGFNTRVAIIATKITDDNVIISQHFRVPGD